MVVAVAVAVNDHVNVNVNDHDHDRSTVRQRLARTRKQIPRRPAASAR
jgi:hypothetical protein